MENAPALGPPSEPKIPGLRAGELDAVRARRAGLRRASRAVAQALREPGPGGPPAPGSPVDAAVARLAEVWDRHREQTEAADGVLAQVLADCPRLAPAIGRLRRQHADVAQALAAVRAGRGPAPAGRGPAPPSAATVAALTRILAEIDRHGRDGRRLLHDAYQVDLGLGG